MKTSLRAPVRRRGLALGVVVAAAVLFGLAVASLLFFSGSQTRSLRDDMDRWRAATFALSGLEAASERLREGRWYSATTAAAYRSSGTFDSTAYGLPAAEGTFFVVAEDTRRIKRDMGPWEALPVVDHVDVFSRGDCAGESVVAYAAFICSPEPEILSVATDGLLVDPPGSDSMRVTTDTLKRLVRATLIRDPALQDVVQRPVRDAIRARLVTASAEYVLNYAQVAWDACSTAPTLAASVPETDARRLLEHFVRPGGAPSVTVAENTFMRDRLYDFVAEGTPPGRRVGAAAERSVTLLRGQPSGVAKIEAFCTQLGVQFIRCPVTPEEVAMAPPRAVDDLHRVRGASIDDAGYRARVAYNDHANTRYVYGARGTIASDADGFTRAQAEELNAKDGGGGIVDYDGVWYLGAWIRGPEFISKPYQIGDPAGGGELQVDDVLGFARKHFDLDDGSPLSGTMGSSDWIGYVAHPPPGPSPPGGTGGEGGT